MREECSQQPRAADSGAVAIHQVGLVQNALQFPVTISGVEDMDVGIQDSALGFRFSSRWTHRWIKSVMPRPVNAHVRGC
jgi:hypothetical protein